MSAIAINPANLVQGVECEQGITCQEQTSIGTGVLPEDHRHALRPNHDPAVVHVGKVHGRDEEIGQDDKSPHTLEGGVKEEQTEPVSIQTTSRQNQLWAGLGRNGAYGEDEEGGLGIVVQSIDAVSGESEDDEGQQAAGIRSERVGVERGRMGEGTPEQSAEEGSDSSYR